MAPLQDEFGWTRAQASVGLTIVGGAAAVAALPIGLMVDRMGPRRVGLIGALLMAAAFGLFSTASGTMANWILLWSVLRVRQFLGADHGLDQRRRQPVRDSRGLAFAVTLSGGSLGAALFPALATAFIGQWGWRGAFLGLGAAWGALVVLAVALFFRGAQDRKTEPAVPTTRARPGGRAAGSDLA